NGRVLIRADGRVPKLVKRVSQATFSGRRALHRGQRVLYVTERCVLELREGGMTVVEVAPGVDLRRDVLDRAGFPLLLSRSIAPMDPRLFQPQPVGLSLRGPRQPAGSLNR
ncbi:MAG: acyl CoA:acetate/3-ketoacid CoA transferase, partial [Candidatus Dormibacteraeota bacterium]|nr:acyl CoA:acetate/3-ketoacid CoA transferase [Candidatus Dormibacteraeota bacterium]